MLPALALKCIVPISVSYFIYHHAYLDEVCILQSKHKLISHIFLLNSRRAHCLNWFKASLLPLYLLQNWKHNCRWGNCLNLLKLPGSFLCFLLARELLKCVNRLYGLKVKLLFCLFLFTGKMVIVSISERHYDCIFSLSSVDWFYRTLALSVYDRYNSNILDLPYWCMDKKHHNKKVQWADLM